MHRGSLGVPVLFAPLLLAGLTPGCHATRLELGRGIGIGAEVQLSGLVRGGALASLTDREDAHSYGELESIARYGVGVVAGPFFWRTDRCMSGSLPARTELGLGLLHGLTHRWIDANRRAHPWAFDLSLALVFFHVRVAFDPLELAGRSAFPGEGLEGPSPP